MRIIAGSARGTLLTAPKGIDTRPTQDKVKESLFNMLQGDVAGSDVLDLFAGSGALGLEALSRGADSAVLADLSREAVQCIRKNVEKLRFQERTMVLACDWQQAAAALSRENRAFDLIFLDPPYRMEELGPLCDALAEKKLLRPGAVIVWERRAGGTAELSDGFFCFKRRSYGDTELCLYRYGEEVGK